MTPRVEVGDVFALPVKVTNNRAGVSAVMVRSVTSASTIPILVDVDELVRPVARDLRTLIKDYETAVDNYDEAYTRTDDPENCTIRDVLFNVVADLRDRVLKET